MLSAGKHGHKEQHGNRYRYRDIHVASPLKRQRADNGTYAKDKKTLKIFEPTILPTAISAVQPDEVDYSSCSPNGYLPGNQPSM